MTELRGGTTKDTLRTLDGLRALAVSLVILEHLPKELVLPQVGRLLLFLQPGYLGVDLFFVLSGFLITRILRVDHAAGWPLRYFLWRRVLRIFPIFYLTVAAVWILRPGPELPWVATYLANWHFAAQSTPSPLAHTWSLAVEEHYYLVWPLLVYGLGSRGARRVLWSLVLPGALAYALWVTTREALPDARRIVQVITPCRMLSLGLGSALAWHEGWLRSGRWPVGLWAVALGTGGYLLALGGITYAPAWFPVSWLLGFGLLSTGLTMLAVCRDGRGGLIDRVLSSAPLRRVGRISYGLYLYHLPVFWALDVAGPGASSPSAGRTALAVVATYALAELSYAFVERPILRLQQRFRAGPGAHTRH
jgi:peptidoglycan/LPS O-acetylase OafA/YrhL